VSGSYVWGKLGSIILAPTHHPTPPDCDSSTKHFAGGIVMSNSPAIIGKPAVHDVTEDSNLQTLIAMGSISISDPNPGQAAFKTSVMSAAGNLGTLTLSATGAYTYSVADSKTQYLGASDVKIDTFTISSVDGTTKQ